MSRYQTLPGYPLPFGARLRKGGVNFSLFSRNAVSVGLILFESPERNSRYEEITLDPHINKTGNIWHIWVNNIKEGQLYGYRVYGPYDPKNGFRFNPNKLLLDPFAKAVTGDFQWNLSDARGYDPDSPSGDLSFSITDSAPCAPRCIVIQDDFSYSGRPGKKPPRDTVIYELHVKGFTFHDSSGIKHKGTFKGLTEKIPYLKDLGITDVELMPIHEFDEDENKNINPVTGEKLRNYWGYSTISFIAPRGKYSSSGMMGQQYHEFKEMIMEFHKAGIDVILDVVFNHTAELDHLGPTFCFRGIDNSIYYMLKEDKRFYKNFSGCGNTFNCNNSVVRDFILDCLRYWVIEMKVDGFRFDLASIMGRDVDGNILSNPPLLERIEEDPILRDTKIIAEAWDAAGAYQVGDFPGRWAEWNGKFRDDVRRFWRGDANTVGYFATRITGSADLYQDTKKDPLHSINFITCHDGFTLNDLVTYNEKHNFENGENNNDGESNNISCNYGHEGPASEPVEVIRNRQIKNFITTLFLSRGIPMLLAGDEFRRTQKGNNNAYCQDNEISWVNWSLLERNKDIYRFCKDIIRFRKEHPVLKKDSFFKGSAGEGCSAPDITWHGIIADKPDWSVDSHFIACLINGEYAIRENFSRDNDIYMAFNASKEPVNPEIPMPPSGREWRIVIDTSKTAPFDIYEIGKEIPLLNDRYSMESMSTVVFIA